MEEGDMVLFEPMSMHSASRCVNGTTRYCWVTSFHDDRVQEMVIAHASPPQSEFRGYL